MLDPVAAVFVVLDGGINVLPVPDTTVLIGLDTNDVLSGGGSEPPVVSGVEPKGRPTYSFGDDVIGVD